MELRILIKLIQDYTITTVLCGVAITLFMRTQKQNDLFIKELKDSRKEYCDALQQVLINYEIVKCDIKNIDKKIEELKEDNRKNRC